MSYTIEQNFIPGLPKFPFRYGIGAYEGIVNHATDNPNHSGGDTPTSERNWEVKTYSNAFVHFFIGVENGQAKIIQTAPTEYGAYGAGYTSNHRHLHLELCMYDDPTMFKLAYDAYVWLTARLLANKNLGVTDNTTLFSHNEISNDFHESTHSDPIQYLASHGISWGQHVANVKAMYDSFFVKPAPTSTEWTPTTNPICAQVEVIVDSLNIRKGPGTQYSIVEVAPKGKIYNVTANINDWHEVIVNDTTKGYAFGNKGTYLKLI